MASLTTYLVEAIDTNGDFSLMESVLVPGNEPPPHVHSREDELYYVLEGEFDVYVGQEAFKVEAGACVFLPKLKPHAFVIRSARLRLLLIITPGGLERGFHSVASPARSLELPIGMPTYSTGDLQQTAQRSVNTECVSCLPTRLRVNCLYIPNLFPRTPGSDQAFERRPPSVLT